MDGGGFGADRCVSVAGEQRGERIAQFALPGHPQRAVLQAREERRIVEPVQQIGPMVAHLCDEAQRPGGAVAQDLLARQRVELGVSGLAGLERAAQELLERVGKTQLVGDRELDVDAFDGVGVVTETRQRDDHVFVDLEGVGVFGDRGGACAVEPELPACVGTDGDEALAAAAVGDADGLAGGARHGGVIFADDVADQHHLGQRAALALGDVADRLEVALIEVLEPRELDAVGTVRGVEATDDLDDRGDRLARFAEEFEADRTHVPRHVMHHPARCGDQAVAAFFLHAGQAAQELVGDILAETGLAERRAGHHQRLGAQHARTRCRGTAVLPGEAPGDLARVVELAEVVADALDLEPVALRVDHAPPGEVVDRGAPEHGFLAARVHGDVAADAAGVHGGGIDREHEAGPFGGLGHALGHDARLREDGGHGATGESVARAAWQCDMLDLGDPFELLGVDDRR